ncbi:uncharacterized protein A4U43_C03F7390 [Asparagus officinalis]|uniref:Uncharacterized protein n=1 Tax=Asparagus officinalis TaxID=4686 RepID=A0A5P1FAV1_ASPOF|nr:uncharacterized protein A4U43_C03F7390 [Asparagus officinalis]
MRFQKPNSKPNPDLAQLRDPSLDLDPPISTNFASPLLISISSPLSIREPTQPICNAADQLRRFATPPICNSNSDKANADTCNPNLTIPNFPIGVRIQRNSQQEALPVLELKNFPIGVRIQRNSQQEALPVLELKRAIPVGYWMHLHPMQLTVLSIIGYICLV